MSSHRYGEEMSVSDLYDLTIHEALAIEQAVASHHLRILKRVDDITDTAAAIGGHGLGRRVPAGEVRVGAAEYDIGAVEKQRDFVGPERG